MFERILYAAEFDQKWPPSFQLLRDLALEQNAEVLVLGVVERLEPQEHLAKKQEIVPEERQQDLAGEAQVDEQLAVRRVTEKLEEAGVFAQALTRQGRIADEVLALADELSVDLIVVGGAPHSMLKSVLTGHITDEIVRKAKRPVLVVPRTQ